MCGTPVEIVGSDEGTNYYRPVLSAEDLECIERCLQYYVSEFVRKTGQPPPPPDVAHAKAILEALDKLGLAASSEPDH